MIHTERTIADLATAASLNQLAKLALVSTRWPSLMSALATPVDDDSIFELLESSQADDKSTRDAVIGAGISTADADRMLSEPLIGFCARSPSSGALHANISEM